MAADGARHLLGILHESIRIVSRDEDVRPCKSIDVKEKPPLPEALISNGAAYRIRTYDVLIRSQTLYPAEVTPRLVDYYAQGPNNGQAFFRKKLSNWIFTHLSHSTRSSMHRDIRKASVAGGFQFQLVRRIGFEPMTF